MVAAFRSFLLLILANLLHGKVVWIWYYNKSPAIKLTTILPGLVAAVLCLLVNNGCVYGGCCECYTEEKDSIEINNVIKPFPF